ncbi:MAG TPA: response regulator transcription factor [Actinophytocola sp.]|uniref:response regulator transcription factor n=1 Tax=Actinophytocola sp. TaxID=1872138 RepID=UPI002DC03C5D|nr:response regulator transcription factor [Actinophytocola sp.]HEU5471588.1 response regulator transcription factor [Actinophytocola sp.]
MVAVSVPSSRRVSGVVTRMAGWHAGEAVPQRIKVLLVADLGLMGAALVSLLSGERDLDVAGVVAATDRDVLPSILGMRPDVVVVDIDHPPTRALELVGQIRSRVPACPVVALAAVRPAGPVRQLLLAGVRGAVDRHAPATRLLEAIRGTARGELVVDAQLAKAALTLMANPLSRREMDVLRLTAEGATGSEIARKLFLSPGTVRNHLSSVLAKVRARNRADAVRIAVEAGWI